MLDKEKVTGELIELVKKLLPGSQLLLVVGLLTAYYYRPNWIDSHRWLTFISFEIAVTVLAVGRFCSSLIVEIWQRHFKDDVLSSVANWLKAKPWTATARGFEQRYRERIILDHEIFNVQGIRVEDRARVLKLEMVFVDLKVSHDGEFKSFNPNPLAVQRMAEARSIWDFLRIKAAPANNGVGLAIVGPPGCGKSTMLQHLAVTLANHLNRRH